MIFKLTIYSCLEVMTNQASGLFMAGFWLSDFLFKVCSLKWLGKESGLRCYSRGQRNKGP